MKIFGSGIDRTLNIYKSKNVNNINKTERTKKTDQLNISETARDYQFAINEIKKLPDVRTKKVNDIKNQIKSGTYEINAEKIAEKIFESANLDIRL